MYGAISTLCYILTGILKLLHPFMPFVTEEIYQMLPVKDAESIMISEYPKYTKKYVFELEESVMDDAVEFIKNFRTIKAYKVFSEREKARIFFEKVETEAEKINKASQIKVLESSIARREKLLSNENYVNKAPANIVENDRKKLEEEKKKLEELKK